MHAFEIVGYAYEADLHCPECAAKRFGSTALENGVEDNEGNEVTPVFASDFSGDAENCGDCLYAIFDAEDEDEENLEIELEDAEPDLCAQCDTILDNYDPEGELCKSCADDCKPGCPGDSAHTQTHFCPNAKAEDDPCSICGARLVGVRAVRDGVCDKCFTREVK